MTELRVDPTEADKELAEDIRSMPDEITELKFDLDKESSLRVISLTMATRYYVSMVIKDPDYLKVMLKNNMPTHPATVEGVLSAAWQFEKYLRGEFTKEMDAFVAKQVERTEQEEQTKREGKHSKVKA